MRDATMPPPAPQSATSANGTHPVAAPTPSVDPPGPDPFLSIPIRIAAWDDPLTDRIGVDPRGTYAERFWLPVLGPSALWLLRRLADEFDVHPDGFALDPAEAAQAIGIGGPASRHAPLARALHRCERFGIVRPVPPDVLEIRRRLPPIPRHRLLGLPWSLQAAHAAWEQPVPASSDPLRRARSAAVDLAGLGEGRAGVERRLLRMGTHPAVAYAAANWAHDRWGDGATDPVGAPG